MEKEKRVVGRGGDVLRAGTQAAKLAIGVLPQPVWRIVDRSIQIPNQVVGLFINPNQSYELARQSIREYKNTQSQIDEFIARLNGDEDLADQIERRKIFESICSRALDLLGRYETDGQAAAKLDSIRDKIVEVMPPNAIRDLPFDEKQVAALEDYFFPTTELTSSNVLTPPQK